MLIDCLGTEKIPMPRKRHLINDKSTDREHSPLRSSKSELLPSIFRILNLVTGDWRAGAIVREYLGSSIQVRSTG